MLHDQRQMAFRRDMALADKMMPLVKSILGRTFIKEASHQIDCQRATDLLVYQLDAVRVSSRVRRSGAYKYRHEFTIRSRRRGVPTELDKLLADDFCQYNFYGITTKEEAGFLTWFVGDMELFRRLWRADAVAYKEQPNNDGTGFIAVDLNYMPPAFFLARGEETYS